MDLVEYPLWAIFFLSIAAIFVMTEIGRCLGRFAGKRGHESASTIEGAILGLQALMTGFTFSMALSFFEARRDAVLTEANAIGTTALRARLLPAPQSTECLNLLRGYIQIPLDVARERRSGAEVAAATARSNEIQDQLWKQAAAIAAKDKAMVPTGLFIQSLNEMIDDQQKRLTAIGNRVPTIVLAVLYGIAVANAFAGYASGLVAQRSRLPLYTIGALACGIILLIQLLDRPSAGLISQQPMIDTASALAAFSQ